MCMEEIIFKATLPIPLEASLHGPDRPRPHTSPPLRPNGGLERMTVEWGGERTERLEVAVVNDLGANGCVSCPNKPSYPFLSAVRSKACSFCLDCRKTQEERFHGCPTVPDW